MNEVKRKLTVILSADVVGYSRLMGDDDTATVETLTEYRAVFAGRIASRGGRVVDAPGDNLLAEFVSAVEAVNCAADIQNELAVRNEELPAHRRMEFRIGINLGDVLERDGALFGDGVNIAARLEGLATAGGVCLSGTAYDQVKNKTKLDLKFDGEQTVKNIAEPVRVYRLNMADRGPAAPDGEAQLTVPDRPSIVVLPFDNISGDPEQAYFSDGITEDIITDLSKISGLFVIARNTAFTYQGHAVNVREVSQGLGVRYVLEGSVRKAGNRVRVTAQLIEGATEGHLWAERYDRDLTDIFEVQDDLTRQIVSALEVTLTGAEQKSIARQGTENVEAYDRYLRAMSYGIGPSGLARRRELLENAVSLDPQYARAHAALANAYIQAIQVGADLGPDPIGRARAAAERAIALNPSDGPAHYVMANYYFLTNQTERLEEEAARAVELAPNSANMLADLGRIIGIGLGQTAKGAEMARKAMRLNPRYPEWYRWALVIDNTFSGRHAAAVEELVQIEEPELWRQFLLAANHASLGNDSESRAARERVLALKPGFTGSWMLTLYPYHPSMRGQLVEFVHLADLPLGDLEEQPA